MPTALENLITARDNFAAKLAALSEHPKPTYSIDGQSVSWAEYYKMLTEQIEEMNKLIAQFQPFIIKSQVL